MVAGHLREKSGYYYAVLNYTDSLGKRKTKWISTGLTVKGNKKRAEAILMDARRNFNPEEPKVMNGDILFADYMEKWLDIIKSSVAVPTFASYSTTVKKIVAPYFREKEVTLKNLTAKDIQEFYLSELERVSPSSVIHYHANIHKALKYAVKIDLIDVNPADKVERPKKDRYVGSFYDADEVNALFEAAKGSKLELPILFGAFYGLRRSEAIGLKWDAIDFDQNTITIRHTVTSCDLDGKRVLVASDTTKTKSSMRTLPLVPFMRERLLMTKREKKRAIRCFVDEYIQAHHIIELYTNNETTRVRDVFVGTQKVLLRRARTRITVENADVLSFLELMNDLTSDVIDDEKKAINTRFISDRKITRKDISTYVPVFPDKAMRTLIESEVIYSVTQ